MADPVAPVRSHRRVVLRVLGTLALAVGLAVLAGMLFLLRFAALNDRLGPAIVLDPERTIPPGRVIVSPADGNILYVRRVEEGMIPYVVKRNVPVPVWDLMKAQPSRPFTKGWLVGIYMRTYGVHVNRIPNNGTIRCQTVFNGPHISMTEAELKIFSADLIPGLKLLRKLRGHEPYDIESDADYILKSARETLEMEDEQGRAIYIVRIADYDVGKILTWVKEGQQVSRGDKLGMITWGSQTDVLIEETPGMTIDIRPGVYAYGGETVLVRY